MFFLQVWSENSLVHIPDRHTGRSCSWEKVIHHEGISLWNLVWDEGRKVGALDNFNLTGFAD